MRFSSGGVYRGYLLIWLVLFLSIRPVGLYDLFDVGDIIGILFIPLLIVFYRLGRPYFGWFGFLFGYLLVVDLVSTEFSNPIRSVAFLRPWLYFAMAIVAARIYASEFRPTPKLLGVVCFYGLSLWIAVALGVLLKLPIFTELFAGSSDSESRIIIPVPFFILFCALAAGLRDVSLRFSFGILAIIFVLVFYYYVGESRQFFIVFMVGSLFMLYRLVPKWVVFSVVASLVVGVSVVAAIGNDFGGRVEEVLYFYNSVSFWIRMAEASAFIEEVNSTLSSLLFGKGLSYALDIPRYVVDDSFDLVSGGNVFSDQVGMYVQFHSADNLLSRLLVDGGWFLAISFFLLFFRCVWRVSQFRISYGFSVFFIFFFVSIGSTHFVTHPGWVFLVSYVYFYSLRILGERRAI